MKRETRKWLESGPGGQWEKARDCVPLPGAPTDALSQVRAALKPQVTRERKRR